MGGKVRGTAREKGGGELSLPRIDHALDPLTLITPSACAPCEIPSSRSMQVCRIRIRRTREQAPPAAAWTPGTPSSSALALRRVFWEILQARLAELLHAISCEAFGVEALPALLGLAAGEWRAPCPAWRSVLTADM